jgi:hypothetical protein
MDMVYNCEWFDKMIDTNQSIYVKPADHKTNMIRVEGVVLFYMKGNQVKKVQDVFFVPR